MCSRLEVRVHPRHVLGAGSRPEPLSCRVSSTSPSQAHSRHHVCTPEVGMRLGVHSEAGPHFPSTWLGALLASRGLLAGCSVEGTAGSKLRAGRTRTVLSLPRSEQGQAAGRGRRWPRRKWLTFAARAGNGQTVKEELECGPSVPAPMPPGDRSEPRAGSAEQEGFGCCWVGASRCRLRVPAGGFLGGVWK